MRENVAENINYIDEVMKKRVEAYKDVHNEQDMLHESGASKTTIGKNQSMSSIGAPVHLLERPNERRKELMDKYSHLLKKGSTNPSNMNVGVVDPFNGGSNPHEDNYEVIFEEMERLKESESESRAEVLQLQNFLRQTRMLQKLREAVKRQ